MMAISAVHYQLLKEHAPLLAQGGALLEIGEANWYGDMDPRKAVPNSRWMNLALARGDWFDVCKCVYDDLFAPAFVDAVDINGTPAALRQDLNAPLDLPRRYDTIINHGTAEHIFNIGQVFCSIHDWCKVGGYMLHESPFTGWIDHGFYCLQPTLFYDLAAANNYDLVSLAVAEIKTRSVLRLKSREHWYECSGHVPENAMLFAVLRKSTDEPFRIPMQGYYDQKLSREGHSNWHTNR